MAARRNPEDRDLKRARDTRYREAKAAEIARYQKKRYQEDRARRKNYALQRRYGITVAQFDAMLVEQGGACAICKTTVPGKRGFHIDHDHVTGEIRALLCGWCNSGLGQFRDNPEVMAAAIQYLARFAVKKKVPLSLVVSAG